MFGLNRWWNPIRTLITIVLIGVLMLGIITTKDSAQAAGFFNRSSASKSKGASPSSVRLGGKVSETSPPEVLQQLRQELEDFQPEVLILSPKPNEVLQDDTINVRLQVRDLPIFKNEDFGLGPHLHVLVDNQPYVAIYDTSEPLVLKDLPPGTHTIRAFASRPWHESFKNEGAYAQTTFHIFTKTQDNHPNPDLPLLTYSRPQGSYGAEPVMLDFYLTNAPLHFVAQENAKDDIADWRIRCTINGNSFVLDRWQPLYLKGFKPGKNWVQLEYLDEQGNPVNNVFNNTVRLITYEPNGQDPLAKLIRGELSLAEVRGIVDPTYKPEPPTPEPIPEPIPSPETAPEPIPSPSPIPSLLPEAPEAEPEPIPPTPPVSSPELAEPPEIEATPPVETPSLETAPETETPQTIPSKPRSSQSENQPGKFFDRFRRPSPKPVIPTPAPATPPPPSTDEGSPASGETIEPSPSLEENSEPNNPSEQTEQSAEVKSDTEPLTPSLKTVKVSPTPEPEVSKPSTSKSVKKPNLRNYFDRFRRSTPNPSEFTHPDQPVPIQETEPSTAETNQATNDITPSTSQNEE